MKKIAIEFNGKRHCIYNVADHDYTLDKEVRDFLVNQRNVSILRKHNHVGCDMAIYIDNSVDLNDFKTKFELFLIDLTHNKKKK